jgi:hypothetical protein
MDTYSKMVNSINTEEQQKEFEKILIAVDKGEDLSYVDVLKKKKDVIEKTIEDLKTFQEEIDKHILEYNTSVKDVMSKDVLDLDVDNISEKILEQDFVFNNISDIIFKKSLLQKLESIEYFMYVAKNIFAQNRILEDKRKGINIRFPQKNKLPKILISKMTLSKISIGKTNSDALLLNGEIKNIASDPAFIHEKTEFNIKGSNGDMKVNLSGFFNTQKNNELTIFFNIDGLAAKNLSPENTDYTPVLEKALADVHSKISLNDKEFNVQSQIAIKDLVSEEYFQRSLPEIINIARNVWLSIKSLNIDFNIKISKEFSSEEFSTDNDKRLSQRFESLINIALGDIKEKIRREVKECFEIRKRDLNAEISKYKDHIYNYISEKQKILVNLTKDIDNILSDKDKINQMGGANEQNSKVLRTSNGESKI